MKRLAQSIAAWVANHVKREIGSLRGSTPEYRAVFNGVPIEILDVVFQELTKDSGYIEAVAPGGSGIRVPVLLQVEKLGDSFANPAIGVSGECDDKHLLSLRNSPECLIYVGLVGPGQHSNLSQTSTRSDFGLSPESNSGSSSITQWINDRFIQGLIEGALDRHSWASAERRQDAKELVLNAVRAADEIDRHNVARQGAWRVLSRLWSISSGALSFETMVALVTGFPPMEDGTIDAEMQERMMKTLSSRLEEVNLRQGIEQLKAKAVDPEVSNALDECLAQLQQRCEVITSIVRAMPYFYAPSVSDEMTDAPSWWTRLSAELWGVLLDESNTRKDAYVIECANPIGYPMKGICTIVEAEVDLLIRAPEEMHAPTEVLITRDVGSAKNHLEWRMSVEEAGQQVDNEVPLHKNPIRYSVMPAEEVLAKAMGKGITRVVALDKWEPGVIIISRTASKGSLPKAVRAARDKVAFEASLVLAGYGRHYVDVFLRPGVLLAGGEAFRSDERGMVDPQSAVKLSKISETEYGLEIEASADCFYQFEIVRPENGDRESIRIYLTAEEISPDKCGSEFERLILLNLEKKSARAVTDVHINRQLRSSDLQTWMLAEDRIEKSYYPLVFSRDYASDWRPRNMAIPNETIYSRGKFINDPRPSIDEMEPPTAFIDARKKIAVRVRNESDGNGLIEAAKLGEWLATNQEFEADVNSYLRSYLEWLNSNPDAAAWCDVSISTGFESDESTLVQEPEALLVSPLHPVRFAWHCLAQKALFLGYRSKPCPAASILDPDCIPDSLVLPLRTASGAIKWLPFFSVECSSDYWGILWNASKLGNIAVAAAEAPFDREFGILIGGLSSGFSVSQVHRALDDVAEMLPAKPMINVLISSAAGQNNACNQGIVSWCLEHYATSTDGRSAPASMGPRLLQVLDERKLARPEDAEISNLAEDTNNSVRWYAGADKGVVPDLAIIAQLETSNASYESSKIGTPLSIGGLIRGRVRQQLKGGKGALLSESRMGLPRPASEDGLADRTLAAILTLENLSQERYGYVFAPSVGAIQNALDRAEYAAVSSASVDPACFLGGWLNDAYLWDYELPSYSRRAGDSNGYYLLSRVKELDRDTLGNVLQRLPGCKELSGDLLDQIILEVARRGIPTVRGLSCGDSGAAGDLGMFVAARVLQDSFRANPEEGGSLLPVWIDKEGEDVIALIIPVDPFKGYLEDLSFAINAQAFQRPDLIVLGICASASEISFKLTPVEVKYRSINGQFSVGASVEALKQARSLSKLLKELASVPSEPASLIWKLAYQHLLVSIISYGFRVYSQQLAITKKSEKWSALHAKIVEAVFSEEAKVEYDETGRLIVVDGTLQSTPRDSDGDGYIETIVLSHADAAEVVKGSGEKVYEAIRSRVEEWRFFPVACVSDAAEHERQNMGTVRSAPNKEPQVEKISNTGVEKDSGILSIENGSAESVELTANNEGMSVEVGRTIDGFEQENRYLNLSDTKLNQLNIGVVGDLGTGKTQLTKSLVSQIAGGQENNRGISPNFLIFDYKRDYSAPDFVQAVGAKVVTPHHLPINLFDASALQGSPAPWHDRFRFFADVLDKIYPGIGPVQRATFKKAIRQAYENCIVAGRSPTIYDVNSAYAEILDGKVDSISSIVEDLVDMEIFSPEQCGVDNIDKFLSGVVVISLDALGQDDRTKNMLVAVMLNIFYEHMLRIQKRPFVGVEKKHRVVDSFLLVDEADNIMRYEFDVLRKILLQGREFGVGVILASQYLRHFKAGSTDYREPLLTWFVHKVPNVTSQELTALGLTGSVGQFVDRIKGLGLHECMYKSNDGNGEFIRGKPFYELSQ